MKALLILAIGAFAAWLYYQIVDDADGETLMSLGILVCIPWVIIAVITIAALAVWS